MPTIAFSSCNTNGVFAFFFLFSPSILGFFNILWRMWRWHAPILWEDWRVSCRAYGTSLSFWIGPHELSLNCRPVLLVPRFGLDDGAISDFEATLVLATMTVSQLSDSNDAQQPATSAQHTGEPRAAATPVPENVSNHTKIWSELSGVYLSCEMLFPSNHWYGCTTCMPSYPMSNWTSLWSDRNQGRDQRAYAEHNGHFWQLALPVSDHNEWTVICLGVITLTGDWKTAFISESLHWLCRYTIRLVKYKQNLLKQVVLPKALKLTEKNMPRRTEMQALMCWMTGQCCPMLQMLQACHQLQIMQIIRIL